jgi:redox-sensitive bicupin YhaK (pirin superfamily)
MSDARLVLDVRPLGFPWETRDPFLFCAHHDDAYPAGNDALGPAASLAGRNLGQDFASKDGWSMYHGQTVPGFPAHPHRGFETVTIVRRGLIDHSDSLGAAARFGGGDVQWLTAGAGIVHAEMFPLLRRDRPNPLELFQIWLNLPSADKMAPPHFAMLWNHQLPRIIASEPGDSAPGATVTVVAGELDGQRPPPPPPRSWAARPDSDVAIMTIRLLPGMRLTLPPARPGTNRDLYFFRGESIAVGERRVSERARIGVRPDVPLTITAGEDGNEACELLLLQGRPINQPVAQYGPFVMNQPHELEQAFADYQRTRFGGWPWPSPDPVHGREQARFARHADGKRVEPAEPAAASGDSWKAVP